MSAHRTGIYAGGVVDRVAVLMLKGGSIHFTLVNDLRKVINQN
jgi:hypothetical protein